MFPSPCRHPTLQRRSSRRSAPGRIVVADRDVIQDSGLAQLRVQEWSEVADRLAQLLVDARDESRPERRHRAGTAHILRHLAVDQNRIARVLVGISGHVGYASPYMMIRIHRRRHDTLLPGWKSVHIADTAAAGTAAVGPLSIIPDMFPGRTPFATSREVPPQAST